METYKLNRKLRMGMIGGGPGSFVGSIHRIAANMDGQIELVCGAFSSQYEKSLEVAAELFLDRTRVYKNYEEMLAIESELPADQKMDFVSIVTPNYLHYPQTKLALAYGFHVVLDKPLALDLSETFELQNLVKESKLRFCLTHTYTGYPMVKEAKYLVKSGAIGKVRKVMVEYPQGWLTTKLEDTNHKQASWRADPEKTGKSNILGDIGTHAFNLLEYVSGLKATEVCADLTTFVEGRKLHDDSSILLRLENGAKGVVIASQVLTGEENSLNIKIWGDKGGLEWNQVDCNTLKVKTMEKNEIYRAGTGSNYLSDHSKKHCRTPSGHPEGYLEAFANIYRNFAYELNGKSSNSDVYDYPGIEDGVRGMLFVEKVLESNTSDQKWVKFE